MFNKALAIIDRWGTMIFGEDKMAHKDQGEASERIASALRKIAEDLHRLTSFLLKPTSIKIRFQGATTMPATRDISQGPITGTPVESNAAGEVPFLAANVKWSIDSLSFATMVQNPDGTATFTPVAAGVANVTVQDTLYNLSFTDTLTITGTGVIIPPPNPPTAIGIAWGS